MVDNGDVQITELPGGRIVKPTGTIFRTAAKTISQMNDVELKAHIIGLKTRLQSVSQEKDSLTIQISQANHEVSTRDEKNRIRLRGIKVVPPKPKVEAKTITQKDAFKILVAKLRAKGLSDAMIADVLDEMRKGQK